MASLGATFNATQYDTTQKDFGEALPNGIYKLEVEAAEVAPTNSGSGTILKTTLKVIEPAEFEGKKIFNNNYNIQNANPVAEEIGKKQLASLCRAIGIETIVDSDELLFQPFYAKVALGKPSTGGDGKQYDGRPEVKKYFFPTDEQGNAVDLPTPEIDAVQPQPRQAPANDNKPAQAAAKPAAAAAAAGGARRPWGK